MGYYTSYALTLHQLKDDRIEEITSTPRGFEIMQTLLQESDDASHCFTIDGETLESQKWYNHEKELKDFSERFSDIIFELYGEGEETGDLWYKYFMSGKMQICKVIMSFEDFDINKLK